MIPLAIYALKLTFTPQQLGRAIIGIFFSGIGFGFFSFALKNEFCTSEAEKQALGEELKQDKKDNIRIQEWLKAQK